MTEGVCVLENMRKGKSNFKVHCFFLSQNILNSPEKTFFFLGVKSSQPHFSYNNFMHPLEQTTIFGIKPSRAHRYVGKPMCVEEIEYINNTIQILPNFCHIDHRRQSRHPFRSSTQLPLQWPQSPLHSEDDVDCHFIEIMVKAILSEIPQHPLSHLTSLCSYPPPCSASPQSEKKTGSPFFPH